MLTKSTILRVKDTSSGMVQNDISAFTVPCRCGKCVECQERVLTMPIYDLIVLVAGKGAGTQEEHVGDDREDQCLTHRDLRRLKGSFWGVQ